ncbi:endonuclease/exonuclease/phosphatase family protein [Thiotrichales bacterium 19S3-7]|nr:endonuclease/exonuclease/phosphatase family protein [Thiotrichales bacterium 19S3-7]MCF6801925.1 endonuclease/exonuclease/phosphatase family protein [Thiotrichales bacterium 19S3-11]
MYDEGPYEDSVLKDINISAMTWNMANQNPPPQVMLQLANQIKTNPDILVFSLQEAKETWSKSENAAQRITKRLNQAQDDSNEYVILHNDRFRVMTKPFEISNYFNIAQTNLVIAVKKSLLKHVSIETAGSESSGNKGGLFASIKIGDKKIGIISVHLDSYSKEKRQQQTAILMDHFKDESFDDIIILGDLNERFETGFHRSDDVPSTLLGELQQSQYEKKLIEEYDPISRNETYLSTEHKFKFHQPDHYTYAEVDTDGNLRDKPKRQGQLDIGALDNIGCREKALTPTSPVVITPKDSTGHAISDHNAVFCDMVLSDVTLTSKYTVGNIFQPFYTTTTASTEYIEMDNLSGSTS